MIERMEGFLCASLDSPCEGGGDHVARPVLSVRRGAAVLKPKQMSDPILDNHEVFGTHSRAPVTAKR